MNILTLIILGFITLLPASFGLDLDDVEEGPCITPPVTNIDDDWLLEVKKWNFIMGNKYFYYRFMDSFLDTPTDDIKESELDSFCLSTKMADNGQSFLHGFGKSLPYFMTFGSRNEIINWRIDDDDSRVEGTDSQGVSYITKTDNITYFVSITYFDIGQKAWEVLSTQTVLDKDLQNNILEHIESFGFDIKHATTLSYKNCLESKDEL